MKDKKYYRNYYAKNKKRINENKRLRRLAKKQIEVNFYPKDSFLNENQPFSCRNRGVDANNYRRMFLEDDLEKKEYRDYLVDFYLEKGKQLTTFNWYCFGMVMLLFVINMITNNFILSSINIIFQLMFLTLQFVALIFHLRYHKKLRRLYE